MRRSSTRKHDEWDQGERDPEGEHDLGEDERPTRVGAERRGPRELGVRVIARRRKSGILRLTKPCMTTWPAIVPDGGRRESGGEQGDPEEHGSSARRARSRSSRNASSIDSSPRPKNTEAAMASMEMFTTPAIDMAIMTSIRSKRWIRRFSSSFRPSTRDWVSAECRYTTCGMTVAPRMPAASRTDSVPEKPGRKRWLRDLPASGFAMNTWQANETTITPTSAATAASSRRNP